jgi:hypothetical protein
MMRNDLVVAIVIGALLALPYVFFARRSRNPYHAFSVGLMLAAAVYVALAIAAGDRKALLVELCGAVLYGTLAAIGLRRAIYLSLGWAAHVGWDLLLHPAGTSPYVPWWYPAVCIGFDLVVAGAILRSLRRAGRSRHPALPRS